MFGQKALHLCIGGKVASSGSVAAQLDSCPLFGLQGDGLGLLARQEQHRAGNVVLRLGREATGSGNSAIKELRHGVDYARDLRTT